MESKKVLFCLFCLFISGSFYLITVTVEKAAIYTEEQTDYYEDLPPAENVLLATGYRTGSSFFAELFNQNDDVLYVRIICINNLNSV